MADIEIRRAHGMNPANARAAADRMADKLGKKFGLKGDWDGNTTDTVGLYDPSSGNFYLRNANASGPADITFTFGGAFNAQAIAGDWNGI